MAPAQPAKQYSPEPNILERKATDLLRAAPGMDGGDGGGTPRRDDFVAARRIALLRATGSGILSGAVIGGAEVYIRVVLLGNSDDFVWREHLPIWAVFYLFVGLITVVEIAFLYWNALDAIARFVPRAGASSDDTSARGLLALGLARGAMEMPNPQRKIYGVDPYAMMPGWRLLVQNLLYKAKVGATSFAVRILMRRILARAVLRGYIPLLAIPLYAAWNAWITWRVMNEAWLRALGPALVDDVIDAMPAEGADTPFEETAREALGELVRRGSDAHPNYVLLLSRVMRHGGIDSAEFDLDGSSLHGRLEGLAPADRERLGEIMLRAALVSGRPRRAQTRFLKDVFARMDMPFPLLRLEELHRRALEQAQ